MAFRWIHGNSPSSATSPTATRCASSPTTSPWCAGSRNGDRVEPGEKDRSIQLRLDAIDAPETHYEDQAQPLATPARDTLVAALGFSDGRYDDGRSGPHPLRGARRRGTGASSVRVADRSGGFTLTWTG